MSIYRDRGITMDMTHPIRSVPALVTEPAMPPRPAVPPPSPPVAGGVRPVVRRLVLRDHEGRMVDVEDHTASPAELDERARSHMAWLRSGAEDPAAGQTPDGGRHYAGAPDDATTVIPAYPGAAP